MLENLNHFTGSEVVYQHPLFDFLYTEGAKYVATEAGAYWLLEEIGIRGRTLKDQPFQVWKLKVFGNQGKLQAEDGNDNVIHEFELNYTDFPEPGIELWFVEGTILLPSEY